MLEYRDLYIVAAIGEWNEEKFYDFSSRLDGEWILVQTPVELDKVISSRKPQKIFFPHWRWIVPETITENIECICFHMTDVPFGRGGSPLQNLIVRGFRDTQVTALRMTAELDAGPVYLKRPMSLEGPAKEIYKRASELTWDMIEELNRNEIQPVPQTGEPVYFDRRKASDSEIRSSFDLVQIYDHIRMLDAPGYPRAFIRFGDLIIEFEHAEFEGHKVTAKVNIRKGKSNESD